MKCQCKCNRKGTECGKPARLVITRDGIEMQVCGDCEMPDDLVLQDLNRSTGDSQSES